MVSMPPAEYVHRLVDDVLDRYVGAFPAVLVTGPRATGKTTTARRHARTWVRLDSASEAVAFRADPDASLRAFPEPLLLDEWQVVPGVLGAVKRAVDDDPRPGRFILTGSVRADLEQETWPGTGRVVGVPMFGLTVREVQGTVRGPAFIDKLAAGELDAMSLPAELPDLRGYVALALRGGFPETALRLDADLRQAWLDSYLDQLLTRDVRSLTGVRDPGRLRRYFEVMALSSASLPDSRTLFEGAGIDRKTATGYDRLLTNLLVMELVPAWTNNRLLRLVKTPKRYLVDPSLMSSALGLDETAILRDGGLMGRLIDTFVASQIRPELTIARRRPRIYHLREKDGRREIDLLAELGAGDVVAIGVKATAAPGNDDARHLVWLRDTLGDRFLSGAILHTGPRKHRLADRIMAVPICALWGPEGAVPVRLLEEDRMPVLDAEGEVQPTTDEQVRRAIELGRLERERGWV
jgi:predicted AAA+ superfamily ATPase